MKRLGKTKRLLLYAGPFPALAFFKIWAASNAGAASGSGSLTIVALFMLAFCTIVIVVAKRWDKPSYFDWTVGAYFALICLFLLVWPDSAGRILSRHSVTGIYGCLFAAAFFPPLFGLEPFTCHYAKKYAPEVVWNNPVFLRINRIMTYAWAGIFALSALLSLYPSIITRAVIPLGIILCVGLPFNLRFPNFYLKRLGLPSLKEQKEAALKDNAAKRTGPLPEHLPESAWQAVSSMPDVFRPEPAGGLKAVIGFDVSGSENFKAYLHIQKGTCVLEDRFSGEPDLMIHTPSEVWLAIARKELSGQKAFLSGAYTANGNLGLLMELKDLFAGEALSSKAGNSGKENALPIISPKSDITGSTLITPGYKRKENTMKVFALNSSARSRGESKTELMLNHLVNGMREAGADVETVNLREKNIKNCVGCFTCMTKTPGKCILKDDMTEDLFPRWLESDLVIYATPLFHHTVNATMKTFIERTWPICEPFLLEKEGRWFHPLRRKHPGVVVLSVCGFPAMSAFGGLTHYVKFLFEAQEEGRVWAEIYRPGAESMYRTVEKQKDILDATTQAGKELVENHRVSPETLARIEQPLTNNVSDFAKVANCMWKTCISEGATLKKFADEGMIPRPDSIETFMMLFSFGLKAFGADGTKAILQFNFSGDLQGTCHFSIENGTISTFHGPAESPDLTIDTPFDVWMDIMTGKADGQQMFMAQKYKVQGDLTLLMRMGQILGNKASS
jgi:multimeric flavodoxin WrbA/putative sterol carrier protein